MNDTAVFSLVHPEARRRALANVQAAPEGYRVTITPPKRSLDQSAKFHAMCADIARYVEWQGKMRTQAAWKVLLISGHAIATQEGQEIMGGLEGEMVNIRESTALMSKKRSASLLDYVQAFGDMHGVRWTEPVEQTA